MILGWNDTADPFKFWVWETVVGLILVVTPLLYLFVYKTGHPSRERLEICGNAVRISRLSIAYVGCVI